jgi:hypothetical protein
MTLFRRRIGLRDFFGGASLAGDPKNPGQWETNDQADESPLHGKLRAFITIQSAEQQLPSVPRTAFFGLLPKQHLPPAELTIERHQRAPIATPHD